MNETKNPNKSEQTKKQQIRSATQKQLAIISIIICFIILVFLSAILLFSSIISDIDSYNTSITEYMIDTEVNSIKSSKEDIENKISPQLKLITENIQNDIYQLDLTDLQSKLNNGDIPSELEDIFANNIEDIYLTGTENDDNDIFICTTNGVISDFSKSAATEVNIDRTWEYEISNQYNSEMAKTTISNILNEDSSVLLVFEKEKSKNPNHIYYDSLTYDNIKDIILSEGLEGLKCYTFLIPMYITKDGDIFGKEDIISGHMQTNNKLIVVQEYNLYQYLVDNNCIDLSSSKSLSTQYLQISNHLHIFAISIIIAVVCAIMFVASLSNNLYDLSQQKSNAKKNNSSAVQSIFGRREYDVKIDELIKAGAEAAALKEKENGENESIK